MYNDYEWKSHNDFNHNKRMVEKDRVYKFITNLNVEFDEVLGRLIGRVPLPSLNEVFYEVHREESHRDVMLGKKELNGPFEGSTLVTADVNIGRLSPSQSRVKDRPQVWCDFCNIPCHT